MLDNKRILALIPARGGSKGLPRKNIRNLFGKPLIAWTIQAAIESGAVDKVLVSTDDREIADLARSFGADAPFLRPAELATDKARGIDVVFHAEEWLKAQGMDYDLVLLLQPTSPLRTRGDIRAALELFLQKKTGAVVSVCECEHSPLWANTIGSDLSMKGFLQQGVRTNRQEITTFYRLNGAIYIAGWIYLRQNDGFFGDETYAYIMPAERSVDIDTELDLKFAQFLLEQGQQE